MCSFLPLDFHVGLPDSYEKGRFSARILDWKRLQIVKILTRLSRPCPGRHLAPKAHHTSHGLCLHLVSQLQEPDQDSLLAIQMPLKHCWIERGEG